MVSLTLVQVLSPKQVSLGLCSVGLAVQTLVLPGSASPEVQKVLVVCGGAEPSTPFPFFFGLWCALLAGLKTGGFC